MKSVEPRLSLAQKANTHCQATTGLRVSLRSGVTTPSTPQVPPAALLVPPAKAPRVASVGGAAGVATSSSGPRCLPAVWTRLLSEPGAPRQVGGAAGGKRAGRAPESVAVRLCVRTG